MVTWWKFGQSTISIFVTNLLIKWPILFSVNIWERVSFGCKLYFQMEFTDMILHLHFDDIHNINLKKIKLHNHAYFRSPNQQKTIHSVRTEIYWKEMAHPKNINNFIKKLSYNCLDMKDCVSKNLEEVHKAQYYLHATNAVYLPLFPNPW
jgi:hypothetical protein